MEMNLIEALVSIGLLVVTHAFAFWRGKEQFKNHPEVFSDIKAKWLDAKADVIATADNAQEQLQATVDRIRESAEAEIAALRAKVADKL